VFGTIKAWTCTTHFLTGQFRNVATETSRHDLKRVIAILGAGSLLAAIRA
jgi:hypothetical protein